MYESRCGIHCNDCERKGKVGCTGCLTMAMPFWGAPCGVKSCCEDKKLPHCGVCDQFPCEMMATMGQEMGFDPEPRLDACRKWAEEEKA